MNELLEWLEQHDKLAGWAQTFGAILALFVAILVPWIQHRFASKQMRIDRLENDLYLTIGTKQAVNDVQTYIYHFLKNSQQGWHNISDKTLTNDLLERLRSLETKDTDLARQFSQYSGRRFLLALNLFLEQSKFHTEDAVSLVKEELENCSAVLQQELAKLEFIAERTTYQLALLQVPIWQKPTVWFSFKTEAGKAWINSKATMQSEKLKRQFENK